MIGSSRDHAHAPAYLSGCGREADMLRGEEFSGCLWMTQVSPESRVAQRNRPLVSLSGFIARRRCVWAVMTVVLLIAPPPPVFLLLHIGLLFSSSVTLQR